LCVNIEGHTAQVRALAFAPDSDHLTTAGLDKVVHVWRLPPATRRAASFTKNISRESFGQKHTVRWEIARGRRGSINALAFSPVTGQLALGGYGARGYTGDLAWIDPDVGRFVEAKYEHDGAILSLCYSPDGTWLASVDVSGRVLLWGGQAQRPREICRGDRDSYDARTQQAISGIDPNLYARPLAFAGNGALLVPVCTRCTPDGTPVWQLRQFAIPSGASGGTLPEEHIGAVGAVAASASGRYLASADRAGRLYLWDRTVGQGQAKILAQRVPVQSLAFSPQGETLAVGTFAPGGKGPAELQLRDIPAGTVRRSRHLDDTVTACAISPDGKRVAYTGGSGHEVFVEWLEEPHQRWAIPGGEQVSRVAAVGPPRGHQVMIHSGAGPVDPGSYRIFDPEQLTTSWTEPFDPVAEPKCGTWAAVPDAKANRLWFATGGQTQCASYLELDRSEQGTLLSWCWITDAAGEPYAVAVGTDVQHGVYVYGLTAAGPCPLLRYFRDHNGAVRSLALSPDRRYVVSGSADGTVRYWSLAGCRSRSAVYRRWGAEFAVNGGRLVATDVDEVGPLWIKGPRPGDILGKIRWPDDNGKPLEATRPEEILGRLEQLPWQTQVVYCFERQGQPLEVFQVVAGWYPLLSVYVTKHDWIAWTPAGYYACSAGGERLLGWQINNSPGQAPTYKSAEQCHRRLLREDVIRVLLDEGSVARALAAVDREASPSPPNPFDAEYREPVVKIITPEKARTGLSEPRVAVTAVATAVDGRPIASMGLLLDGKLYHHPEDSAKNIVRESPTPSQITEARKTWTIDLTPGTHTIQVKSKTDRSDEGLSEEIRITYTAPAPKRPSLFLLAIGISTYRGQPAPLQYAHTDAAAIASTLDTHSHDLFETVDCRVLSNELATRDAILGGLEWLHRQVEQAAGENRESIAVIFYSGHGMNDSGNHFYLVPVDADPEQPAETCVSGSALRDFCAKTRRCKLVVLLDACHSGGINLSRFFSVTESVEHITRELGRNDFGVIMMASSCGNETSLELNEIQAGAFTKALVESLEGQADDDRDGLVLIPVEAYSHTRRRVLELTQRQQTPINSNTGVMDFAITKVADPAVAKR